MTFIDTLRNARTSRVAVLHEFWSQHNPSQARVHAFFEGHDDVAFFSYFIERKLPKNTRLYVYRCEGKARVYEAFAQITSKLPAIRSVLFFVDKDLDDILGTAWPTDPRVFVTDVYSVENYMVTVEVLQRLLRDAVKLKDVAFDHEVLVEQFSRQLLRFHRQMLVPMAWILVARRTRAKPNLQNVDLSQLFLVSDSCELRGRGRGRLGYLARATGVGLPDNSFRHLVAAARELARLPAKRVIRGKFEAWFLVEFWKRLLKQLVQLANEKGGKVSVKLALERDSFCTHLKAYPDIPRALELFLGAHLPTGLQPEQSSTSEDSGASWTERIRALLRM